MCELWNRKTLEPPPMNTAKVKILNSDVRKLYDNAIELSQSFDKIKSLDQEAALLSRVIYRMKHKFRHDKGFKTLEKVNRALLQYLNLNYKQLLDNFQSMIDTDDLDNSYKEKNLYLPTKQLLQFLLVRTQGFAKLLCRIIESCQITAEYMNCRISSGQSWPLALLVLGLCSRIHTIATYLIRKVCQFYDRTIGFEQILGLNGTQWLPSNYQLPTELFPWLDFDLVDYSNFTNDVNILDEIVDNSLDSVGGIESRLSNQFVNNICQVERSMDLGMPISRETFQNSVGSVKKPSVEPTVNKKKKKRKQNLDKEGLDSDKMRLKQKKLAKIAAKKLKRAGIQS